MRFAVSFEENEKVLPVSFDNCEKLFDSSFENIQTVTEPRDYYEGDYSIVPKVDSQVIPTAEKAMKDDLTVMAIPIYNVSNTSGGSTVYIAMMDE